MNRANLIGGLSLLLYACGPGYEPPGPGITLPPPPAFLPGPHTPLAQIPKGTGPVLANPNVVSVTFQGDPTASDKNTFCDFVVTSSWLAQVGAEYGVQGGKHSSSYVLPSPPASMLDSDIQATLVSAIAQGSLPSPATDPNLVYVVFLPSNISVTLDYQGQNSGTNCSVWGGYHHGAKDNAGHPFPYAVVGDCPNVAPIYGWSAAQFVQMTGSHELIESATDPLTLTTLTYGFPTSSTSPWIMLGGEVADLCPSELVGGNSESGFLLSRAWSNAAAAKGDDPCNPATTGFYFNAAGPANAVLLSAGASTQVDVQGWSTGPVADWQVATLSLPASQFNLSASLDRTTLNNNEKATLTLQVPPGTPSLSVAGLLILSKNSTVSSQYGYWPVLVGVP